MPEHFSSSQAEWVRGKVGSQDQRTTNDLHLLRSQSTQQGVYVVIISVADIITLPTVVTRGRRNTHSHMRIM